MFLIHFGFIFITYVWEITFSYTKQIFLSNWTADSHSSYNYLRLLHIEPYNVFKPIYQRQYMRNDTHVLQYERFWIQQYVHNGVCRWLYISIAVCIPYSWYRVYDHSDRCILKTEYETLCGCFVVEPRTMDKSLIVPIKVICCAELHDFWQSG